VHIICWWMVCRFGAIWTVKRDASDRLSRIGLLHVWTRSEGRLPIGRRQSTRRPTEPQNCAMRNGIRGCFTESRVRLGRWFLTLVFLLRYWPVIHDEKFSVAVLTGGTSH
jgi:hypothetical protein